MMNEPRVHKIVHKTFDAIYPCFIPRIACGQNIDSTKVKNINWKKITCKKCLKKKGSKNYIKRPS